MTIAIKPALFAAAIAICIPVLLHAQDPAVFSDKLRRGSLGNRINCYAMAMSRDGKTLLASNDTDGSITLWSTVDRKRVWQIDAGFRSQITSISHSPTEELFVANDIKGGVAVWNDQKKIETFRIVENSEVEASLVYFSDADTLFAFNQKCIGQQRKLSTKKVSVFEIVTFDLRGERVRGCRSRGNKAFAIIGDGKLFVYKESPANTPFVECKIPFDLLVTAIAISDDGRYITGAVDKGRVFQFDVSSKEFSGFWEGDGSSVRAIEYLHQSSSFVTAHESGKVIVWNNNHKQVASVRADREAASLAIAADNSILAVAGQGQPISLWNLSKMATGNSGS